MPLDPVIHQQNRLQLLATLARNHVMSFTELRDACGLTTGNAGSHLEKLEEAGYVKGGRLLVGFGFELHYRITERGSERFREYLAQLRALVGDEP
jgi:DNA-binding MarR family transcriptional regulator